MPVCSVRARAGKRASKTIVLRMRWVELKKNIGIVTCFSIRSKIAQSVISKEKFFERYREGRVSSDTLLVLPIYMPSQSILA